MNFNHSFISISANSKTGPIPVTRTDKNSCPQTCPLLGNGCYAAIGRPNIWWKKLDYSGLTFTQLLHKIKTIKSRQIWRHNEAGDLHHIGDNLTIDSEKLEQLTIANLGKKGFTYTHYSINNPPNLAAISAANLGGFTVNASSESDQYSNLAIKHGLPVVQIMPYNTTAKFVTSCGDVGIICPNQLKQSITCDRCKLCAKPDRKFIIGFLPHGVAKNKVFNLISNGE